MYIYLEEVPYMLKIDVGMVPSDSAPGPSQSQKFQGTVPSAYMRAAHS